MNPEYLPPILHQAWKQSQNQSDAESFEKLTNDWRSFAQVCQTNIPEITYLPDEELLTLGEISPGCHLCRQGKWECIFITNECNLDCRFCLRQHTTNSTFSGSNISKSPQGNLDHCQQVNIEGLSFSGGEALLKPELLKTWLQDTSCISTIHYRWLYSNGMLITENILKELATEINEIRINAAAANYNTPALIDKLKLVSQYIPTVTIEIPMLPEDLKLVLSALPQWINAGVKHLNLHELIYEPNSNSERCTGKRETFQYPDLHEVTINPESKKAVLEVFKEVKKQNYPISVNFCSTIGKWKQLTSRREQLLPLSIEPYEAYAGNGRIDRYYCVAQDSYIPIKAEKITESIAQYPGMNFYHLQRIAPLSPKQQAQWVLFEILQESF